MTGFSCIAPNLGCVLLDNICFVSRRREKDSVAGILKHYFCYSYYPYSFPNSLLQEIFIKKMYHLSIPA